MSNELALSVELTGSDTAGLFDPKSEEVFASPEERQLLASLLSLNDRVDVALPDGMAASELWRTFEICARVFVRVRRASGQLKLLIGRGLAVIQDTPEIFESRGFSSFDEFMSDEVRGLPAITSISRAELYKAKAVAKSVGPGMNLDDARAIGFSKMKLVTEYSKVGDSNFKPLMEAAKDQTIPELRQTIARMNLADANELEYDVIQVSVTKAQKKFILGFLANPQVRSYCNSESPGTILESAISEVIPEWQIAAPVIEAAAKDDL